MKKLILLLIILFLTTLSFISCNGDIAETHQVKPMKNEGKFNSMGLIDMTEKETNSISMAIKPIRGILPNSHDLSDYFPPVGSQDNQGSCAAWSSGYNYKSFQENFERGWGYSTYDHIMSPAFVYNYAHQGESEYTCNNEGMTLKEAADILKNVGIVSWSEMPYNDKVCSVGPTRAMISDAYKYRIDDYKRVEFDDFRTFLASNMPIFFGGEIFENFGNCWSYSSCMTEYRNNGNVFKSLYGRSEGGHGMVIVGYNDQKQAFKIINSWGTSWGDNGYLWVSYPVLKKMVKNYGSYGFVFIDHIENPCENVDCGYHGECKSTPQKTAYCKCDNGYKADLLSCVKCKSNSYKQCSDGSIYWYNSCEEKGELFKTCNGNCENLSNNDAKCVANCESHKLQKCDNGDIYWFNSCGKYEGLALDCGRKVCDDSNGIPECKQICTSKFMKKCFHNNVYWYDSCGVKGLLIERCSGNCINLDDGGICQIANKCENVNCPSNANCQVQNEQAACYCNQGYHLNSNSTACEADNQQVDLCENVNCPSNANCQVQNEQAACYCNQGYHVNHDSTGCDIDEVIPPVCDGINCEQWYGNSKCVDNNGKPACDCKYGFHWSGDNCIK